MPTAGRPSPRRAPQARARVRPAAREWRSCASAGRGAAPVERRQECRSRQSQIKGALCA